MADFDPNKYYAFEDKNGNIEWHKGDNELVRQAVESGVPISLDNNGAWHILPWADRSADGRITFHIPQWFAETEEYDEFVTIHEPYFSQQAQTNELMEQANKVLERLGKSAYEKKKQEHIASQESTSQDESTPTDIGIKNTSSVETSMVPEQFQHLSSINTDATGVAIGLMIAIAIAGIVCILRGERDVH